MSFYNNNSPYTNGRPPGSVALPGIHSVAARAAFINAGKSREEGVNHLCSPQNVNGKRLPGLADLVTGGNNGFKSPQGKGVARSHSNVSSLKQDDDEKVHRFLCNRLVGRAHQSSQVVGEDRLPSVCEACSIMRHAWKAFQKERQRA